MDFFGYKHTYNHTYDSYDIYIYTHLCTDHESHTRSHELFCVLRTSPVLFPPFFLRLSTKALRTLAPANHCFAILASRLVVGQDGGVPPRQVLNDMLMIQFHFADALPGNEHIHHTGYIPLAHFESMSFLYIPGGIYIFNYPPVEGSSVACGTFQPLGLGLAQFAFRTPSFGPCLPSWLWRSGEVWSLDGSGWMDGWMDGWKVEKTRGISWGFLVYLWGRASIQIIYSVLLQQVGWNGAKWCFLVQVLKYHRKTMDVLSGTTRKAWLLKITESKQ